jgi:hypothetical protein
MKNKPTPQEIVQKILANDYLNNFTSTMEPERHEYFVDNLQKLSTSERRNIFQKISDHYTDEVLNSEQQETKESFVTKDDVFSKVSSLINKLDISDFKIFQEQFTSSIDKLNEKSQLKDATLNQFLNARREISREFVENTEQAKLNIRVNENNTPNAKPKRKVRFNKDVDVGNIEYEGDDKQAIIRKETHNASDGLRADASDLEANKDFVKSKTAKPKDPYYERTEEHKKKFLSTLTPTSNSIETPKRESKNQNISVKPSKPALKKSDNDVLHVVNESAFEKNIGKNISIISSNLDENDKVNIVFRAENPNENAFVKGFKKLFKLDQIKTSMTKKEFSQKFSNTNLINKNLQAINAKLKPTFKHIMDGNLRTNDLNFDAQKQINELKALNKSDKSPLQAFKKNIKKATSRAKNTVLGSKPKPKSPSR